MKKTIAPLLLISLVLFSCIKSSDFKVNTISSEPDLVLPFTYGDFALPDLVKRFDATKLKTDANNLIYLEFRDTIPRYKRILPSIILNEVINSSHFRLLQGGTIVASVNDAELATGNASKIDYTLSVTGGAELKEIKFKGGELEYKVYTEPPSDTPLPYGYDMKISNLVDENGDTLKINRTDAKVGETGTIPLKGYTLKMPTANNFTINYTPYRLKGAAFYVAPGTDLVVSIKLKGMEFQHLKGYFGYNEYDLPRANIEVDILAATLGGGKVEFQQAEMDIELQNEFRVPAKIEIKQLIATKMNGAESINMIPSISDVQIPIPYPEVGKVTSTHIGISNSNDVLAFNPDRFTFLLKAITNSNSSTDRLVENFLSDTSKFTVIYTAKIPLFGKASGVIFKDTLKLDLNDIQISDIREAALRIQSVNELPLEVKAQFYFADEKIIITDSLFNLDRLIVEASDVTPEGVLKTPGRVSNKTPLTLSVDKVSKLFESKYLIMKATINTSSTKGGIIEQVNVKFLNNYKLSLNVALALKFKLKIKL